MWNSYRNSIGKNMVSKLFAKMKLQAVYRLFFFERLPLSKPTLYISSRKM